MNNIYLAFQKIPILRRSYHLKFLLVSFIGIHIPLIGIIIFITTDSAKSLTDTTIITLSLILTLVATTVTLTVLRSLLAPLSVSKLALKNFLQTNELPDLPTHYNDEAGELMSLIQKSMSSIDVLGKQKQQMIALVSHNLRTPLNQIKGLVTLIEADKENSEFYVKTISNVADLQLKTLKELLNDLMQDNFMEDVLHEEFDLTELMKDEVKKVEIELRNKNISLIINSPDQKTLLVSDKKKISLIIHNLLTNAIKFSFEHQKIVVDISFEGNKTLLKVIDQGMGFNEEYKSLLFKDSRNVGRPGTKEEPSVGLGLHLCKRLIRQIGGDLTASSEGTNKGATFTLSI